MAATPVESRSKLCAGLCRVLYFEVPNWPIYAYIGVLVALYVFVVAQTPLAVQPDGIHDDEFFMSKGWRLAQGHWLGPFSQYTLMKGPGYSAFLAAANWTGLPISWVHALFRSLAVVFFVVVAHRFIRSYVLSGILLALLLWHPYSLAVLRMLREQIYPTQVLLILAAGAAALYLAQDWKQRIFFAAFSGLLLGWFWLTREEGIWILPGLVVLLAPAVWFARRQDKLGELTATVSIALVLFAATQIGFRAMNWHVYGKYVGVDFKERNFQAALRALHSVRSGGVKPFVGITQAAREHIYKVSPHFATLRDYLEGPPADGWRQKACARERPSCGEMGPGSFIWALRDAAAAKGHYVSPGEASAFFGSIAEQVSAACASGKLECDSRPIPEMPPFTWSQLVGEIPPRIALAVDLLANFRPDARLERSTGLAETLATDVQFLNYPAHTPSTRMPGQNVLYTVKGQYQTPGGGWFFAEARDAKGLPVEMRMSRHESPPPAQSGGDPETFPQRFTIEMACDKRCVLSFRTSNKDEANLKLRGGRKTPITVRIGQGELVVDSIANRPNPAYALLKPQMRALSVRAFVMANYRTIFIPVLILGVAAFVIASVLYWRSMFTNVCYILAATSWILVASRAGLLILIDATAMQTLQWLYLSAAFALLVCAAMFSIAALPQLACQPQSRDAATP